MKIAVEDRKDPNIENILNSISTLLSKEHEVYRFTTRFSGCKINYENILPDTDLTLLWNGEHPSLNRIKEKIHKVGSKLLVSELGWITQKDSIQIDHEGINVNCSWANFTIPDLPFEKIKIQGSKDILVILQCDNDVQITHNSGLFENMFQMISFLKNTPFNYTVRSHPRFTTDKRVVGMVKYSKRMKFDQNSDLMKSIKEHKIICNINSTVGFETILSHKPLISFGNALYNKDGICCHIKDLTNFNDTVNSILNNNHNLCANKCRYFIDYILSKQVKINNLDKVKEIINKLGE